MDIVLIAGMWLEGSAWAEVASELTSLGHRPVPLTLPGQGDGSAAATLDDQVEAVVAAVDAPVDPPMVVGHSAAASLAWLAADRRPDKVAKVVFIGGFPRPTAPPTSLLSNLSTASLPSRVGNPSRAQTPLI